ncbi:hypothetical protein N8I74_18365 [Chitiniphilus purpureus]|uniref:Uncharacterized protein n=1 Tax=Chitiniphilus purpureus TaxID=2981137 RepID=A0ABY6DLN5_9NEIS|nr:hypothetical protein [Chitiniphilus sp. CD1]UXY15252.1 hypothetical protein N8I74_18365 [Chitiniphilus sp. CD1]
MTRHRDALTCLASALYLLAAVAVSCWAQAHYRQQLAHYAQAHHAAESAVQQRDLLHQAQTTLATYGPRLHNLRVQGVFDADPPAARQAALLQLGRSLPALSLHQRLGPRAPLPSAAPVGGLQLHAAPLTLSFRPRHEPDFAQVLERVRNLPGWQAETRCELSRPAAPGPLHAVCSWYWLDLAPAKEPTS